MDPSQPRNIPITRLRPQDRIGSAERLERLLASFKVIGLVEPLLVCREGKRYLILDGSQRYRALLQLGMKLVPCVVTSTATPKSMPHLR